MTEQISLQDITFVKLLGKGGYGEACLYTLNSDPKKQIAIKSINKDRDCSHMIDREVVAGQSLNHKNIGKFYSRFEDADNDYLAFEFIEGTDLFKYYRERNFTPFTDKEAHYIFRQVAKAVMYCHDNNVAHLDIKLDNIMIDPKTHRAKLIDFGLCNFITESNQGFFDYRVGSSEYWPAEMVPENVNPYSAIKVDVWCLGIVLFCLLNATFPYDPKKRITRVRSSGEHPGLKFDLPIAESAKDLIRKMLHPLPHKRITMKEVLKHPWAKKRFGFPKFWKE